MGFDGALRKMTTPFRKPPSDGSWDNASLRQYERAMRNRTMLLRSALAALAALATAAVYSHTVEQSKLSDTARHETAEKENDRQRRQNIHESLLQRLANEIETQGKLWSAGGYRVEEEYVQRLYNNSISNPFSDWNSNVIDLAVAYSHLSGAAQKDVYGSEIDPAPKFRNFPTVFMTEKHPERILSREATPHEETSSLKGGNAVRVGRYDYLSNQHVAGSGPLVRLEGDSDSSIDVALVTANEPKNDDAVAEAEKLRHATDALDPVVVRISKKSDAEILGKLGVLAGIDPDGHDIDGTKRIASILVPVHDRTMDWMYGNPYSPRPKTKDLAFMRNSFLILTDPLFAKDPASPEKFEEATHGLSGSPVFDEQGDLVAIFHRAITKDLAGRMISFGFVHTAAQIRDLIVKKGGQVLMDRIDKEADELAPRYRR